jgi:hypothetical protein
LRRASMNNSSDCCGVTWASHLYSALIVLIPTRFFPFVSHCQVHFDLKYNILPSWLLEWSSYKICGNYNCIEWWPPTSDSELQSFHNNIWWILIMLLLPISSQYSVAATTCYSLNPELLKHDRTTT